MQELIETIKGSAFYDESQNKAKSYLDRILTTAEELRKKEKQQISDAFDAGKIAGIQFQRGTEDDFEFRHKHYEERKSEHLKSLNL